MSSPAETKPRRLFLALWPDEPIRTQLARISTALPAGRRIAATNLHMTLVFLGATAPARQNCYQCELGRLTALCFELCLNRLVYWRRSGIVSLAPTVVPAELAELVASLNKALQTCGFQPESRPFKAHITLARNYPRAAWPLPQSPKIDIDLEITWRITCFTLLESVSYRGGVRYCPVSEWAFQ